MIKLSTKELWVIISSLLTLEKQYTECNDDYMIVHDLLNKLEIEYIKNKGT